MEGFQGPVRHTGTMGTSLMAEVHESELIEGCVRGDKTAQRQLFDRYRDRVYSIALHYLRGDEAAALDVTQDVFVKVFRAIGSFRQDARLSTWLYRVVANRCMDELRRSRRWLSFGDLPPAQHPRVSQDTHDELQPDVARAIQALGPKLRIVVLLRHFDDLSYDEIATTLGLSAGTVASRLSRAHASLARALAHLKHESNA